MYVERPSRLPGAVLWRQTGPGAVRVLPDGCMDLIRAGDRLLLAGPDTTAAVVELDEPMVGLRFPPGLAPALLAVPAVEVRDRRPDLADVRRLSGADTDLEALALRLAADADIPRWTGVLVRELRQGRDIAAIAGGLGWSVRQLHRKCLSAFGYGASVLAGILRFQRGLDFVAAGATFADAGARAGYADQPHFAREVRRLSGVTLSELVGSTFSPRLTEKG